MANVRKRLKNTFLFTEIDSSHFARDLLTKMLEDDPDKRISSEEVVKELNSIKIEVHFLI